MVDKESMDFHHAYCGHMSTISLGEKNTVECAKEIFTNDVLPLF